MSRCSGDARAAVASVRNQISGESINRSAFIELAVKDYLEKKAKKLRDQRDLEILNKNSKRLNREAQDVLSYQVEL